MTFIKAAGIGYPVKKSKSPVIYGYWMEQHGVQGCYDVIELPPQDLHAGVQKLIDEGYAGFSVTLPHKQTVMEICDDVDARASAIGAVNSVKIDNGKLLGTNTDVFGFVENIKMSAPAFDFSSGPAVVLGAGGAARAVVYGLLEQGVPEIRITNRTRNRAEDIQAMSPEKIIVIDWEEREEALAAASLLVNTTSLGMEGQDALDIDLDNLPTSALVNDIVYYPLHTNLLNAAKKNGNAIVTGIGMLAHQARPSYKNWFGHDVAVTDELMKRLLA